MTTASRRTTTVAAFAALSLAAASQSLAQTAGPIYTWNTPNNVLQWFRSFGAANTSATLANTIPGELTITETSSALGGSQAFSDDFNRIRETPAGSGGGLDLTGLSSLEFDLAHNGTNPVNVQFYVQASTGSNFVALGPDIAVSPGLHTYSVPLAGLTPAQIVYIRTIGMNFRDHAADGNLTWSLQEVRSVGAGLTQRDLITHDAGTPEGGLQGAIVNFDNAAVSGNNGGQNQTGLTWNSAGTGSLLWTDLGGSNGAAITWGNGTAWNNNTFNNRTADLSNYNQVTIRMSAGDLVDPNGSVPVTPFFQRNNFQFQALSSQNLPTDGQYHDLVFDIPAITGMNVVDTTGINLGAHTNDLIMNVDLIRFNVVPEPTTVTLAALGSLALMRRRRPSN